MNASRDRTSDRRSLLTSRWLAWKMLRLWTERGVFLSASMAEHGHRGALSAADRAFAGDLAAGVVRRIATIDAVLQQVVTRPRSKMEDELWTVLRLGAYQLLFMDHIPDRAAVHETAQLARAIRQPKWVGIVNAVLRGLQRERVGVVEAPQGRRCVARNEAGWLEFRSHVVPDPATDAEEFYVKAFSYPKALIRRWLEEVGAEETEQRCRWFNATGPMMLRVNTTKIARDDFLAELTAAGIRAIAGGLEEIVRLEQSVALSQLPGFQEGLFSVQDESAAGAVDLLNPHPGQRVLDLCAAPGGKTGHIAERLVGRGDIMACDVDDERLDRVRENITRLGFGNVVIQLLSSDADTISEEPFDAVLVDVPCSNTGVLGKRPEARWRLSTGLDELLVLQQRLLSRGASQVRPGGRLLYSTCSIEAKENRGQVDRFLEAQGEFSLVEERHWEPGRPADGAYQALLIRGPATNS